MRGRKRSRNTREYMLLRNGSIFIFVIILSKLFLKEKISNHSLRNNRKGYNKCTRPR